MKKTSLLFAFILFCGVSAFAQTTYMSPNTSTTVTVTNAAAWHAVSWTPAWNAGDPQPWTYVVQPNFTILVGPGGGNTVNLTGEANLTLDVQGKVGFYNGNNDLQLAATATVNIGASGAIGYSTSGGGCCNGNSSNNLVIGTNNMSGPFTFTGPDVATQSSTPSTSTHWLLNAATTAWATAGNWSNGVPTASKHAFITNATTNDPSVTTSVATDNLTIVAGGQLNIASGGTVAVNGVLDLEATGGTTINSGGGLTVTGNANNDGTVLVKSGGSFVQGAASAITNAGTFTVERAIPGGVSFVSSPVSNIGVNSFGITTTGANGGQVKTDATNPCNSYSVDPTSPYGNLMELQENATLLNVGANCAQELWFVKSAGTLTNGRGYSLTNGAATLSFTGTPNNGAVTYANLTRQAGNINNQDASTPTRGWHLVGNPYPSPISFNTNALLAMGFDAQVHRYNHNGAYTGTWVSTPANTVVTIAVGQSFQIRKTAVGGTSNFSLTNADRVVSNPTFYKLQSTDFLEVSLNNGIKTDTTNVFFTSGATDNFDPDHDANRMSDAIQHPMIFSVVNSEWLSYNALAPMAANSTKDVVIGVRTEVPGAHTLTFNGVNSLTPSVVLEDLKLNVMNPISEGSVYHFTTQAGDNRNRFVLHFSTDATGVNNHHASGIVLSPNPTTGLSKLVLPAGHGFDKLTVTDVCGRSYSTTSLNGAETVKELDLTGLSSGIYFVKLSGAGREEIMKIVKK